MKLSDKIEPTDHLQGRCPKVGIYDKWGKIMKSRLFVLYWPWLFLRMLGRYSLALLFLMVRLAGLEIVAYRERRQRQKSLKALPKS
uniref:Uncharacterized protein n=1 Tax=Cyanothece sp. (strain PCC 7425 / ATCC 29141) TaxID=395961 RepID=B8HWS9_CYAP4